MPVDGNRRRRDKLQGGIQTLQRRPRIIEMNIAEIQSAAVMASDDKEANHLGGEKFEHFADGEKVIQAFRHLHIVYIDKAVVHPNAGHGFAVNAFGLSDFVFMVGKL